jgi:MFS family permease
MNIREPLFGDSAIFQYTGWCIRHGMRLYRDVGMADGPFIHYLHAGMQALVGTTDRAFRKGDLTLEGIGGAILGLLLAPSSSPTRGRRVATRIAWAAMGAAFWLAYYFGYGWTETTERETYYSLFGSIGLVLVYVSDGWRGRRALVGFFLGGLLTASQAFGKPTGVVYPALGLLAVLLPSATATLPRKRRVQAFLVGVAALVALVLFAFLVSGSIKGYFLWCWRIPYVGNRYLWGVDWLRLLLRDWPDRRTAALATFVVSMGAIAAGLLPVRALSFALAPLILYVGACLQGRGYAYHFIPLMASCHVLLLLGLSVFWRDSGDPGWTKERRLAPFLALAFFGYHSAGDLEATQFAWDGQRGDGWYKPSQHFADAEKQVGEWLKANTNPEDRVFAYVAGENASIILLYAERKTASPFFHSFWLDPVGLSLQSEIKPDAKHLEALKKLQADIQAIACTAVEQHPPRVMTLNLLPQVYHVCPNIQPMLEHDYDDAATVAGFHVYMRKAQAPRLEDAQSRRR